MSDIIAWSRTMLYNRSMIVLLFIVNLFGTIYGYMWYGDQMTETLTTHAIWMLPFVPDSPTASLFFTIALLLLLLPDPRLKDSFLGGLAVTFGLVTSVKYGIWAVAMIFAGAAQGDQLVWQDWMLVGSHLGMAFEAVLFVGLFSLRPIQFGLVAIWMIANDVLDYNQDIYPWLSQVLMDDLSLIEVFTLLLSLFSLVTIVVLNKWSKIGQTPIR